MSNKVANEKTEAKKYYGKGKSKSWNGKKSNSNFKRDPKQTNDFKWWSKYPALIKDAGEFTFNQIAGTHLNLEGYGGAGLPNLSLPNVMALKYYPTIGTSLQADSPFNAQIRSLWLDMHRKYRGIGTYESADLGAFIFCAINLFANIARAEKIYGYYRSIGVYNRALPSTLLNAMGVSYEAGSKGLPNFRAALDLINQQAAKIMLPKGFSAYEDAVVLASATLKDSDSERASLYTFDSPIYYVFSGTAYSTGSACLAFNRSINAGAQFQTFDNIIDDLWIQLDPLLNDSDCQRMASDILAAYGENGVETRASLDEGYVSPIGKDEIRLLQIHNATILGGNVQTAPNVLVQIVPHNIRPVGVTVTGTPGNADMDIVQFNNMLVEQLFLGSSTYAGQLVDSTVYSAQPDLEISTLPNGYYMTAYASAVSADQFMPARLNDRILDTWHDDVTLEEKVEMTRFTVPVHAAVAPFGNSEYCYVKVEDCGTNVLTGMGIYSKEPGLDAFSISMLPQVSSAYGPNDLTKSRLTNFDWHPIFYPTTYSPYVGPFTADFRYIATDTSIIGDIDHCVPKRDDTLILRYLHSGAMMSAYKCELNSMSKLDNI